MFEIRFLLQLMRFGSIAHAQYDFYLYKKEISLFRVRLDFVAADVQIF